jgi:PBP1b-binding outer membrane lipoprotein LpoB
MRTPRILIAVVALAFITLAGCSEDGSQAVDESPSPATAGTVVEITIDGDTVEPNGARVEAQVGEPITLQITSDREGELHVHSTPEQEISFDKGTTQAELTIDQPGIVEVEDHHSDLVIVQLEVS